MLSKNWPKRPPRQRIVMNPQGTAVSRQQSSAPSRPSPEEKGETQRHTALQGSGQVRRRGGIGPPALQREKKCATICRGTVNLLRVPDQTDPEPSARPQPPTRWAPRAAKPLFWGGNKKAVAAVAWELDPMPRTLRKWPQ